ncbi:hypothetical protein G9A89_023110 [Geosiphon pyriformis]|nr:hypothetical protein G9A89_023110 [Geosiphon pyriformis]
MDTRFRRSHNENPLISALIPVLLPSTNTFYDTYSDDTLDFSVIGDWGTKSKEQALTATTLQLYADRFHTNFIVNVGDNFYLDDMYAYDGVNTENDEKFQKVWLDVYTGSLSTIPWYTVAGNHDWYNNVTAEVDYSINKNSRFFLPSPYYVRRTTFGPKKTQVAWIHIDTNPFYYTAAAMKSKSVQMYNDMLEMGWLTVAGQESLLKWIEGQLALVQDAKWIFVVGHHPLIGNCGNSGIMNRLPPLFDNYKVTAYFSGHSHTLAYKAPDSTVGFADFLSGSGAKLDATNCEPNNWGAIKSGFLHVSIEDKEDELKFEYVDASDETIKGGKGLYNGKLPSRNPKKTNS